MKNLGIKPMLYPMPVLVIGTYDEEGNADAMVAAWGGVSCDDELCICLSTGHKTVKNFLKTKSLTVSFATSKYTKEVDYLGVISGNNETNKLKKCGFHVTKSKKVNAPIIKELPVTLECELIKYDKKTCHTFVRIKNIVADDKVLVNGKVDIKKLDPILYDCENYGYYTIGKKVGQAYSDYKKVLK